MPEMNWLAIVASTVAAFILGGLWYGPLFSNPWMREMGIGKNYKPRAPLHLSSLAFRLTDNGPAPMIAGPSQLIRARSQIIRVEASLQSHAIRAEIGDEIGPEDG